MENLPSLEASGAREIASRLKSISGGKVLDICTGKGDFISTLMQTLNGYERFIGIDMSRKDLEVARKTFEGQPVQFMEMDAGNLAFDDNTFDTVCIANSLHHLSDPGAVLNEMKRVLKHGGHFIVQEMYQDGDQSKAQITDTLEHHWGAKIDRQLGEIHYETLTKKEIKTLLETLEFQELLVLEASRYVKCLVCPQRFACENPLNEKLIDDFISGIEKELKRLPAHKVTEELKAEGEQLKERAKITGVADASFLFFIGR
ncbi:MAG: class I SAM-dependent methyltransferase [Candidatus Hermodarchaeota archaeon]|nr:class I SAM-dependent methyltransferase [Candidatus Hermodarchaeota archaeon]